MKKINTKTIPCPCSSSCSVRRIQAVLNGMPDLRPSRRAAATRHHHHATSHLRGLRSWLAAPSPTGRSRQPRHGAPPTRHRRASNRSCRPPSRSRARVWGGIGRTVSGTEESCGATVSTLSEEEEPAAPRARIWPSWAMGWACIRSYATGLHEKLLPGLSGAAAERQTWALRGMSEFFFF